MIIIGVPYLDESVGPTTTTFAKGDVLSIRAGVHWVSVLQPTLEFLRASSYIILAVSISEMTLDEMM